MSSQYLVNAIGARKMDAKVNLKAEMTKDGMPSFCANRIKMLDVETARIAITITAGRINFAREFVILWFIPHLVINCAFSEGESAIYDRGHYI